MMRSKEKLEKFWKERFFLAFILLIFFSSTTVSDDDSFDDDDEDVFSELLLGNFAGRNDISIRLKPLGFGLMGDKIDPDTGTTVFSVVDVSIPGNSKLEVAIRRSTGSWNYTDRQEHYMADWLLEIPSISEVWPVSSKMARTPCSRSEAHSIRTGRRARFGLDNGAGATPTDEFSRLNIPGQGSKLLLENIYIEKYDKETHKQLRWSPYNWQPIPYRSNVRSGRIINVTTDHWIVGCLDANTVAGGPNLLNSGGAERYIARSPDGTKYTFDHIEHFDSAAFSPGYNRRSYSGGAVHRHMATIFATKIEDVNGNWVKYTYSTDGKLTRIHSNDGREITLTYLAGTKYISTVTANGRTWTYTYKNYTEREYSGHRKTVKVLHRVTQPDGKYWEYDIGELTRRKPGTNERDPVTKTITIKHPYGTLASYGITDIKQNSINLATLWGLGAAHKNIHWHKVRGVVSKTLANSTIATSLWQYRYSHSVTTVIDPAGRATEYYYSDKSRSEVGKARVLAKVKKYDSLNGTLIEEIVNTYKRSESFGAIDVPDESIDEFPTIRAYLTKRVVKRGTDTYTTEYTYNTDDNSSAYSYGKPISIKRYSNVSTLPRETVISYTHKKNHWILGLRNAVTTNGRNMAQHGYDSLGRKTWENRYGTRVESYTYHTGTAHPGAPHTIMDANGQISYLTSYYRGVPRYIRRPDGVSDEVVVDANGWITGQKDHRGYWARYERDNMGRVTKIVPSKTQKMWLDTNISYVFGDIVTQTITRGNKQEAITYDTLFRPTVEKLHDTASSTSIYVKTTYNAAGETTYKSFPSAVANPSAGMNFTYDGLGRVKTIKENVAPYATTTHSYLSNHRHQIRDPSGQTTTYHRAGYAGPDRGQLLRIAQPMSVNTYLYRNVWGQMYQLRQVGTHNGFPMDKNQYFYFGSQQRLCRHRTLEGGDTLYAYDAAGRMTSYSRGMTAGYTCETPRGVSKVTLTRDVLGRVTKKDFADSATTDIDYTYDNNGNELTVKRGDVQWAYSYDELNHPTSEQLDIDSRNYDLTYTYDTAENLIRRILPSGRTVDYTHDGFGRQTAVRSGSTAYASSISYHANGSVAGLSFGNGHKFTKTLNVRLLPQRLLAQKGTVKAIDLNYTYDVRGKILSLNDGKSSSNNRTLGYDALGRLVSASGPWGTGSFKYDALGNLREKKLGSRKVTISYDSKNRATSNTDTGGASRQINYDNRGNVTSLGTHSFVHDHANQPVSVSGTVSGTYSYDGNLRRVKSVVSGKTIYSVYDKSGSLVHVHALTDARSTDYIKGAGMTLARITNNIPTYLHLDHLGSPAAGTDSNGTVSWTEQYTPFGEKRIDNAANRYLGSFTGHIDDSATGLTYMQARYYDPVIGRFLSIDPVQFKTTSPMSFNRYQYANLDPINAIDPNGKDTVVVLKAYPLGDILFRGEYGHSFVEYKDSDPNKGEAYITRAGPSKSYSGNSIDVLVNKAYDDITIRAENTVATESTDYNQAGGVTVSTAIIKPDVNDVISEVDGYMDQVNASNISYQPRGPNSNTYAGDIYEMLTGEEPVNNTNLDLDGLDDDLSIGNGINADELP